MTRDLYSLAFTLICTHTVSTVEPPWRSKALRGSGSTVVRPQGLKLEGLRARWSFGVLILTR